MAVPIGCVKKFCLSICQPSRGGLRAEAWGSTTNGWRGWILDSEEQAHGTQRCCREPPSPVPSTHGDRYAPGVTGDATCHMLTDTDGLQVAHHFVGFPPGCRQDPDTVARGERCRQPEGAAQLCNEGIGPALLHHIAQFGRGLGHCPGPIRASTLPTTSVTVACSLVTSGKPAGREPLRLPVERRCPAGSLRGSGPHRARDDHQGQFPELALSVRAGATEHVAAGRPAQLHGLRATPRYRKPVSLRSNSSAACSARITPFSST